MVLFNTEEELRVRLSNWHPAYGDYAKKLWAENINSTEQLAHAAVDDLAPFIGNRRIHASDIIKRAGSEGAGADVDDGEARTLAGLKELGRICVEADVRTDDLVLLPDAVRHATRLPFPLRTSVYVRKCYRLLLKLIDDAGAEAATVLTGTPGIGKSAFALVLLCHLAKKRCKVVYRYPDPHLGQLVVVMDFQDPADLKVYYSPGSGSKLLAEKHIDAGTWVLVDGILGQGQHSGVGTTVVMTSPNETNWHDFKKGRGVRLLHMDVWSLREIKECLRLFPEVTEAVAVERFRQFGGAVRYVLANAEYSFAELEQEVAPEEAAKLIDSSLLGTLSKVSHTLVHMRASKDGKLLYFMLASPEIAALVFRRALSYSQRQVAQLIKASAGHSSVAGFRGIMFEQHGHVLVPAGVCVRLRQLLPPSRKRQRPHWRAQGGVSSGSRDAGTAEDEEGEDFGGDAGAGEDVGDEDLGGDAGAAEEEGDEDVAGNAEGDEDLGGDAGAGAPESHHFLEVQPAQVEEQGSSDDALRRMQLNKAPPQDQIQLASVQHQWDQSGLPLQQLANCYLQPSGITNASWDAYYCSSSSKPMILQYTVSDNHSILAQPVVRLLERLGCTGADVRLVFVVPSDPPELYDTYKWQSWLGVRRKVLQRLPAALKDMQQWVMQLPLSCSNSRPGSGGGGGSKAQEAAGPAL